MNLPNDPNAQAIPADAKGNPVYEQTREDMPLWCCGRNCGRNSRIAVIVMAVIGIICSTWCIFSAKYFSFEALRNDTFYEEAKAQPEPFEHAVRANVGLFRYEILEVFEYPWPPKKQPEGPQLGGPDVPEPDLGNRRDLQGFSFNQTTDPPTTLVDSILNTLSPTESPTGAPTQNATEAPTELGATLSPSSTPTTSAPTVTPTTLPPSPTPSYSPTMPPSAEPTITDPNLAIDDEIGVVKKYEDGMKQFEDDSSFSKAQLGAFLAPIFAAVGLVFCIIEFCFCHYRCSWLPTALFLYLAFMFQSFTLFLFLSEDFCKYDQDCKLGFAGVLSVIAVLMYMISNTLICCTPRPPPCFDCCKKAPKRRKKKKKKKNRSNRSSMNDSSRFSDDPSDSGYGDDESDYSGFQDEPGRKQPHPQRGMPPRQNQAPYRDDNDAPEGYVNPYDDNSYADESAADPSSSSYGGGAGDQSSYGGADQSYYSGADDQQTYGDGNDQSYYSNDDDVSNSQWDDSTYGSRSQRSLS
eukprot:CAMPEP_0119558110 /NCGR_PEP_ID=MMETSP1352-20130426/10058_1 /TAXON_ID=265584 /ORGANISM="Stauroneis constricta, Strain CCMP1120" /LENGTH=521 /DNA_ID=CAMNT_0007605349 /DNA_START=228 /DNA_END=1793 /DNA_ORIENTATION=+